jgi:hypothetical protein
MCTTRLKITLPVLVMAVGLMCTIAESRTAAAGDVKPALATNAQNELESIPRKLSDEPKYASKEPRYCLLVFGPKAETRIWLVLDLAYDPLRQKPGKTESLHADLNGNGKLTDAGERIPVTVKTVKRYSSIRFGESEEHEMDLPQFNVGDVKSADGKIIYKNLVVDVGWYVVGRPDREVTVSVDVPGQGRQSVGGDAFWFGPTAAKAPVIWFDGALTMRMAPSGLRYFPIDYSGKEPAPPYHEVFPLVRGEKMPLRAEIGTAGMGVGTFNVITCDRVPADVHPLAEVTFSNRDPKKPPIKVEVSLNKRCCGSLF